MGLQKHKPKNIFIYFVAQQAAPTTMIITMIHMILLFLVSFSGLDHRRREKKTKSKSPRLTFFVATNISTTRCFMRRGGSGGYGVFPAVSYPIICLHMSVVKKLKGKKSCTSHFVHKSSRTLRRMHTKTNNRHRGNTQHSDRA